MATAIAIAAVNTAQDEILGEVFIAAPPARVFEAITDPSQVPRWWGQQGIYRVTQWNADLRPGESGRASAWAPMDIRSESMGSILKSIHRVCSCTPGWPVGATAWKLL